MLKNYNDTTDITSLAGPQTAFGKKMSGYKVLDTMELRSNTAQKGKKHIIYIRGARSFKCCDDEIGKRLSKILFARPWSLHTQRSTLFDEKTDLKRENAIKSFLPLVFEQEKSLVDKW
ncbi:9596_t:CDS:2 [Rhizophagus irregularis]|nr:9596_t:CDS:2 [Rhizophagus irregularis]